MRPEASWPHEALRKSPGSGEAGEAAPEHVLFDARCGRKGTRYGGSNGTLLGVMLSRVRGDAMAEVVVKL